MPCFFCNHDDHRSEDCNVYETFQDRISQLKYRNLACLCSEPQSNSCKCKKVCGICCQHHHEAFCPKRDPSHKLNVQNKNLGYFDLLSLGYVIFQRFFNLCNPIEKIKLQRTCKYFNQIQPFQAKLIDYEPPKSTYRHSQNLENIETRTFMLLKDTIEEYLQKTNITFLYPSGIYLCHRKISKFELIQLANADPTFLFLECEIPSDLTFLEVLEAFPFVWDLTYPSIPQTWISDLINAKRNVELISFRTNITESFLDLINMSDLYKLFNRKNDIRVFIYIMDITQAQMPYICEKLIKLMKNTNFILSGSRRWKTELIFQYASSLTTTCFSVIKTYDQ